jgi:hypothetical protein
MIKHVLDTINEYLSGKYTGNKTYPFYLELEKELLYDNYEEMYKENKEITEFLNEEIPELCAMVSDEIGIDEFKKRLKVEYLKALELYKE